MKKNKKTEIYKSHIDSTHLLKVTRTNSNRYVGSLIGPNFTISTNTVHLPEVAVSEVYALWRRRTQNS